MILGNNFKYFRFGESDNRFLNILYMRSVTLEMGILVLLS